MFRAVVFYENRDAGHLARRALDLMEGQLGMPNQEIAITLWRLDVAGLDDFQKQVQEEIGESDLIIIASTDAGEVARDLLEARRWGATRPHLLLLDPAERLLLDANLDCLLRSDFKTPAVDASLELGWSRRTCC